MYVCYMSLFSEKNSCLCCYSELNEPGGSIKWSYVFMYVSVLFQMSICKSC